MLWQSGDNVTATQRNMELGSDKMKTKYRLLKDISHPFGDYKMGEIKTVEEWLSAFGVDWISSLEDLIENNPYWFEKIGEGVK